MSKNFSGETGTSIRIITEKVKLEVDQMQKKTKKFKEKSEISGNSKSSKIQYKSEVKKTIRKPKKISEKSGILKSSDWSNISIGLEMMGRITNEKIVELYNSLLAGNEDVEKTKVNLFMYQQIINDFFKKLRKTSRIEYNSRLEMEMLEQYPRIAEAARDGVLVRQEKRIEVIDGAEKELRYDVPITEREVIRILRDYEKSKRND